MEDEVENIGKTATVLCVQYLISEYMKNKSAIKRDDLMKTVFKGRVVGKNYDRIMADVSKTLKDIFGFSISNINNDSKQFIIVNKLDKVHDPKLRYSSSEMSKCRLLLKPIILTLVMLQKPISEGQMWNMMEKLSTKLNLDADIVQKTVKQDFVRDQYLLFKATDETTVQFDPERISFWFSMGPRALAECNQKKALQKVAELFNKPVTSFVRVHSALYRVDNSSNNIEL